MTAPVGIVYDREARTVTFGDRLFRFALPDWAEYVGNRPTSCRSCGATVLFLRATRSGKSSPIDPDGKSHFATCPDAPHWRARHRAVARRAVTPASARPSAAAPPSHLPGGS